jgi:hypothetical protein
MRMRRIVIIFIVLIAGKLLIDFLFKIKFSRQEIYEIKEFVLNDSLKVKCGKLVVGKNIKGRLEAILLPINDLKVNESLAVEYIYLRFPPEWFDKNIKPLVVSKTFGQTRELIYLGEALHKSNFHNYSHINDYPLMHRGYMFYFVKIRETGQKIRKTVELKE